jgi:small subunit ribosomal protein S20
MPVRKKTIKSLRQSLKRRKRNKRILLNLKKQIKKFNTLIAEQKIDEAKNFFQKTLLAKIDKAAKQGVIHKNTASRKKSRLSRKLIQPVKPS